LVVLEAQSAARRSMVSDLRMKSKHRKQPAALVFALTVSAFACGSARIRDANYLDGYAAIPGAGLVQVVVEIPAGTNDKWEVGKSSGALHWEYKNGKPRVVQYLAYPGNYGMIPRTSLPREVGGDGDPLDVLLLGAQVERGSVVRARPIGVLKLVDDGERDDKIIAVPITGPLSDAVDLETLDAKYPGVREIVETWFTHYKGPGRITSGGYRNEADALAVVREASRYYEERATPSR